MRNKVLLMLVSIAAIAILWDASLHIVQWLGIEEYYWLYPRFIASRFNPNYSQVSYNIFWISLQSFVGVMLVVSLIYIKRTKKHFSKININELVGDVYEAIKK